MGAAKDEIAITRLETDWRDVLWSPAAFAEALSGGEWKRYRHLEALDSAVMGMIVGDTCDVLLVEMPVRHGKSLYCSQWLPAWYLTRWPNQKVGLMSYADDFAAEWGRKTRGIMQWHGAKFGVTIDKSSSAADRWDIQGTSGGMWTEGVGGQIIGKGYNLAILDDPLKNDEEARSRTIRDKIWNWWQGTFISRGEPGRKIVVVMSRWNVDDLIGRLKVEHAGLRIRVLTLPALAEEDDPLGREPGEALCPERYTREDLLDFREATGSYIFSAQYQQSPIPDGGAMLDMAKAGRYDLTANGYELGNRKLASSEALIFTCVDLAATTTTRADYTVAATFGVTRESDLMVLDVHRVKAEAADHLSVIDQVYRKHKPTWIGIEKATFGISLIQAGMRAGLPIRPLEHGGRDKITRAESARVMLDGGHVWLPRTASWLHELEKELAEFPNGRHDDQVDVVAYACGEVLRGLRGRKLKAVLPSDRADEHLRDFGRKKRHNRHPILGRF
jgi:predicted phage terminase large subunit-like protein